MRDIVTLACSQCKNRNYTTTRNKKRTPNRLELKKYCRTCQAHTLHKQVK